MAAWSILNKLALVNSSEFKVKLALLGKQRRRQMQFGRFLNRLCQVPAAVYDTLDDDTVICRCEEVTMGAVRRCLAGGFTTLGALKKATRCGMGCCQGRLCGPVLLDIASALTGQSPQKTGRPSVRAPIKPVPIGAFLDPPD